MRRFPRSACKGGWSCSSERGDATMRLASARLYFGALRESARAWRRERKVLVPQPWPSSVLRHRARRARGDRRNDRFGRRGESRIVQKHR
jgi:hypothetical protein